MTKCLASTRDRSQPSCGSLFCLFSVLLFFVCVCYSVLFFSVASFFVVFLFGDIFFVIASRVRVLFGRGDRRNGHMGT